MSEYILLTLKDKSKIINKKFYWKSENGKKSIGFFLNLKRDYYTKKYINMIKKIEKNLSKYKINILIFQKTVFIPHHILLIF